MADDATQQAARRATHDADLLADAEPHLAAKASRGAEDEPKHHQPNSRAENHPNDGRTAQDDERANRQQRQHA